MRQPAVELSECIKCGVCQDVCPEVFLLTDAGFIQVTTLSKYPEECIAEAIKLCPADCIYWEPEDNPGDRS